MKIENNIIKHYLKNVMFINGTAYAGKSTMCRMLAERYDLIHCRENYHFDVASQVINQEIQPNLNYFNTMKSWEEFLNRTPDEYERWINGNIDEIIGFEIAELIRLSQNKKVIVDTNIPVELLKEIADYHQIAIMLSSESMAVDRFFHRSDEDKNFLLDQIMLSANPESTMDNFKACLARVNSKKNFAEFANSGCYVIIRENSDSDTKEETLEKLATHFKLIEK